MPFVLSDEINHRIQTLATDLDAEVEQLQGEWDEKTEAWQDSDEGNSVLGWIQDVGDAVDTLGNLDHEPPA